MVDIRSLKRYTISWVIKRIRPSYLQGRPLQRRDSGVDDLESMIMLFLSCLFFALRPCHGNSPFARYIRTYIIDSKSSLLLYSTKNYDVKSNTVSEMSIYRCVAGGTSKREVLCLRNMHPCFRFSKFLCETKVYNMNYPPFRTLSADCKVLWFDIPVDVVVRVHEFNPPQL